MAAFFTGDALAIYFDIKADKLINVLVDLADLAGQAVELLHLLGVKFGQGFTNLADRLRPLVEAISTATSSLRGLLQLPFVGALIQGVFNGIVNYLLPGLEGPFGTAMSLAEVSLGGAFADFIRAGGHALAYIQTQVEHQASSDLAMPIAQFCRQDGGRPE